MHTTLTARSLSAAGAAVAAAVLLLSGCSSAANSSSAQSGVGTAVSSTPTAPSGSGSSGATAPGGGATTPASMGGAAPVVVHNADKGRTVTLHAGQVLEVQLTGGYWPAPTSSAAAVLRASGAPVYLSPSPGAHCAPGVGCRPEQTAFTAVAPGTATVSATRTNCGEAMRCTDANGKFSITVTVVA